MDVIKNKQILFFLLLSIFICSCQNRELKNQMQEFCSSEINLPLDDMLLLSSTDSTICHDISSYDYVMVVHIDSISCTPCVIKSLCAWNSYKKLEKSKKVKFVFIFSVNNQVVNEIKNDKDIGVGYDLYIDSLNIFVKKNPQVGVNRLFHRFMIDKKGKVVLVGDPSCNDKVEKLFFSILKDSSKHQQIL